MKRLVTCAFTIILRFHTCQTLRPLGACHHNTRQVPKGAEGTAAVLGDRIGARGQNRCQGAAAGPGRASRSITPSRRLACGDLAGGPPPTGTWTKQLGLQRVPHAGRLSRTWAGLPRLGTAGPRADEKAAPRHAKHAKHEPHQHDTSYNPTCEPPRLEGATGPVGPAGPAGPCRASDRPLRAAGSRRAYCRSDSSRFARTTMPMRSTIASSTQLPSSAARRECTGASSKRRSKPRIARHRGMSSSW